MHLESGFKSNQQPLMHHPLKTSLNNKNSIYVPSKNYGLSVFLIYSSTAEARPQTNKLKLLQISKVSHHLLKNCSH